MSNLPGLWMQTVRDVTSKPPKHICTSQNFRGSCFLLRSSSSMYAQYSCPTSWNPCDVDDLVLMSIAPTSSARTSYKSGSLQHCNSSGHAIFISQYSFICTFNKFCLYLKPEGMLSLTRASAMFSACKIQWFSQCFLIQLNWNNGSTTVASKC